MRDDYDKQPPEKPEDKDKAIVDHIVKEFDRYEAYHQTRFDEALDIIEHWDCVAPIRDEDWQNAVVVPVILEAEQTITPRIFTALFPTDAPLDVKNEGDTPAEDAIIIKALIQHYFRTIDVRTRSLPLLMQNTLLGTGYADAGSWLIKRGFAIGPNGERSSKITANRPDFTHVDFFEMYPHPYKVDMDDGLPLIRKRYVDAETLKTLAENNFFGAQNLREALESDSPEKKDANANEPKEYELLEYWGPWNLEWVKKSNEGDKVMVQRAVPFWCMVINRKVLIRSIPNPYNHQMPPFVKTNLFPSIKPSWFGVGVGKIGLPTQERLNKIINQRLDNVDLVLNKMGIYSGHDPLLNPKQLSTSKPGKWIKCSDIQTSMKWMDIPDVTASSYKEEEVAKADFRISVGASEALTPGPVDEQHRTAMGIQLLQGAAGMRFKPVLTKLEMDLISKTADFFFMNCKQFMTTKEWVEVMGDGAGKMVEITPDQIQRKVKFVATGISETINKETQIGQLLRFKEVTAQDPTINRTELNKRIGELFGFKDLNKLVVQQSPAGGATGGSLTAEQENMIRQRVAEGASPDQIKQELLGPAPTAPRPGMQGRPR